MSESKTAFTDFGGLDNRPLRQQIADLIEGAIMEGELKPGDAIVETDIAGSLGVSRGPVREAIQLLASRNLLDTIAYRGTTVRELSRTDVEEAYSLRTVFEIFAIRRVIDEGRVEETVGELREICDAMQKVASEQDWRAVAVEDDRFHHTLIRHADHGLLMSIWGDLNVRIRQIMALRNLQNRDIMQIVYNHIPIVQAIADRNVDEATRLVSVHIASAADLMADGDRVDDNDDEGPSSVREGSLHENDSHDLRTSQGGSISKPEVKHE